MLAPRGGQLQLGAVGHEPRGAPANQRRLSGLRRCQVTEVILARFLQRRSKLPMATLTAPAHCRGLLLSALFWSSFSPWSRRRTVAGGDRVVEERRIEREF